MSDQPFGRSRRDFMRIAVTAGTTDPVISLLLGDTALEGRLQLDGIVTTVDAKQTYPAGQGDRQFHRRIAACGIPWCAAVAA
jgi:G3E family GTPase